MQVLRARSCRKGQAKLCPVAKVLESRDPRGPRPWSSTPPATIKNRGCIQIEMAPCKLACCVSPICSSCARCGPPRSGRRASDADLATEIAQENPTVSASRTYCRRRRSKQLSKPLTIASTYFAEVLLQAPFPIML